MNTVLKPLGLIAELNNSIIKSQGFVIIHNNKEHFRSHFAQVLIIS